LHCGKIKDNGWYFNSAVKITVKDKRSIYWRKQYKGSSCRLLVIIWQKPQIPNITFLFFAYAAVNKVNTTIPLQNSVNNVYTPTAKIVSSHPQLVHPALAKDTISFPITPVQHAQTLFLIVWLAKIVIRSWNSRFVLNNIYCLITLVDYVPIQ